MRLTRREEQGLYSSLDPARIQYAGYLSTQITLTPNRDNFLIPTAWPFLHHDRIWPHPNVAPYKESPQ